MYDSQSPCSGRIIRPAEGNYTTMPRWRRCGECDRILPTDFPANKLYCKSQCARKAARKRDKERKNS